MRTPYARIIHLPCDAAILSFMPLCRTRSPKLRPQLSHFISGGLSLSTLYGLAMLTPLLYLGLLLPAVCTVVRGIEILRTSPFGDSAKFAYTEF